MNKVINTLKSAIMISGFDWLLPRPAIAINVPNAVSVNADKNVKGMICPMAVMYAQW